MTTLQKSQIYITDQDKTRLLETVRKAEGYNGKQDDLTSLVAEIERATVVEQRKMPRNVVTMNSRFSVIDMETSERFNYTLVYPEDADVSAKKISVLAPVGAAMLGYGVGDEFEWEVPGGTRKFQIAKVDYQPEARKHYHL